MGFEIVQRSAGSHSPIDIFAICRETRQILFVQSKPESFSKSAEKKIKDEMLWLDGNYEVTFEVQ